MVSLIMIRLAAALALFTSLSVAAYEPQPAPPMPATDTRGRTVDLSAEDRPTIVLFWATWCPFCRALMPHLQSIIDEHGQQRVNVLALSIFEDDDADPVAELEDRGLQFRAVVEADGIAETWGVDSTPGLFLVSGNQIVWHMGLVDEGDRLDGITRRSARAARLGPLRAAALRQALDKVLP